MPSWQVTRQCATRTVATQAMVGVALGGLLAAGGFLRVYLNGGVCRFKKPIIIHSEGALNSRPPVVGSKAAIKGSGY
eukprot:1594700-Pyramimonas_sp.AAC.2